MSEYDDQRRQETGPWGGWSHLHPGDEIRTVHPDNALCNLTPLEWENRVERLQIGIAVAKDRDAANSNPIEHPAHYLAHPSGVECITIPQWMGFNLGNVIKYVWRADLKGNAVEDLKKARQYLDFEIARLESM